MGIPNLSSQFLPAGSDEQLDLVLFVLNSLPQWANSNVDTHAASLIAIFDSAWDKCAKTGPSGSHFNKCWNNDCAMAKLAYNACPCHRARSTFHKACDLAKKTYFTLKMEDMVKHCKPWTGTQWIKD